jgi:hypothetical protein
MRTPIATPPLRLIWRPLVVSAPFGVGCARGLAETTEPETLKRKLEANLTEATKNPLQLRSFKDYRVKPRKMLWRQPNPRALSTYL